MRITRPTGNIFLTNIHRVYAGDDIPPSPDDENTMDYFLGKRPTGATTDSKVDLGMIVRDIDELMVLNDEAHHIHDPRMAWFKSIEDIHNRLKQKGAALSLQVDVTATPKHNNGAIFVQTVADYPLVEAISQNVVKHPVLPDAASRAKLVRAPERQVHREIRRLYSPGRDRVAQGVCRARKAGQEGHPVRDDRRHPQLRRRGRRIWKATIRICKDAVLVIHTKNNGEISESTSGKSKEELEKLRKQANEIDGMDSPYKAIISVMVLKEGWDVRNVTTIVGLRAYSAKSNILPEQTLGRGLRKMYPGGVEEYVSVVGTNAFMDFVESIQAEGVVLERKPMGEGTEPKTPLVVEIDKENVKKDIDALDIEIPVLTPRVYREYKNLSDLDVGALGHQRVAYLQFSEEEQREIVFKDITTGEVTHTTILDTAGIADYRSVIGYFAQTIMKDLRLVSGYDVLYGKVKAFVQDAVVRPPGGTGKPQHAAQPVGTGGHQDPDRDLQEGDQCADRAGQRRRRNPRHHQAAADAALSWPRIRATSFRRRASLTASLATATLSLLFARFLEDCERRGLLRQELPGRAFQAGLRERRRRHFQLLSGFSGQAVRQADCHCRNQRAGRSGRAAEDGTAAAMVRRHQPGADRCGVRLCLRGPREL